jgi:hypothetical protein
LCIVLVNNEIYRLLREAKMQEAQSEAEILKLRMQEERTRDREDLAKAYREQDQQDTNKIK